MKAGIIDLRTAKQPKSSLFITPAQVNEFLEENADLYWEQIREIGKKFSRGVLVTDARLHHNLYLFHASKRVHDDKVLDVIRIPAFPGEEFVCLQLGFRVPVLGDEFVAWKWFFFRQPRQFGGMSLVG